MTKKQWKTLATLLVGLAWTLAAYAIGPTDSAKVRPSQSAPTPSATTATGETLSSKIQVYPVVHIVDGDTIDVQKDGTKVRVRLIGINSPESVDPRRPVQCFGKEASAEMKRLVGGKSVTLEIDPSQDTYDKYGRLLAYVFLGSENINLEMIQTGYAYEYTYHLPYKYQQEFKAAQKEAAAAGRGLWAAGVCGH